MTTQHLGARAFPAKPEQTATARRWLGDLLGNAHPARDDSVLLLSETLTNSILHGCGDKVEVSAFSDETSVHVEVVDDGGGATLPHYVDDPCGENGRGLPIMRAVAREWGFELLEGGRLKVWFDVPHDPSTSAAQPTSDGKPSCPSDPSARCRSGSAEGGSR